MVINDHDAVNASGLTVFRDVGKVTGIRLPDLAEFVLFIGLTVPEVRISCRFEIVEPDKTLHGIHTDGCREKGFLHEMLINLRGIHAWMLLLDPVGTGFLWDCRKEYVKQRTNLMEKSEKESARRMPLRKERSETA